MNKNYNILLTGTIDSSKFSNSGVKVVDTNERLSQYESAIKNYITSSIFNKIVFVENSGFPFNPAYFAQLAKDYGKQFEFIYVNTDIDETIKRGKSYGEAVLIREGIGRSQLLIGENEIYKSTGRVFVENSEYLCKKAAEESTFLTYNDRHICFTVFFKINMKDYEMLFHDLENECDDYHGNAIENVLYNRCLQNSLSPKCFKEYPRLHGVCGTDGHPYDRSNSNLFLKDFMIRCGLFTFGNKNLVQRVIQSVICSRYPDVWW